MDTERVREHFRVQVSDYAGLMKRLIPFYDQQREMMLRLIPFNTAASIRVLDLGCGPGLMADRISESYSDCIRPDRGNAAGLSCTAWRKRKSYVSIG